MSDINGDGKQTNEDITILDDFINKKIPYLPSQWNKLQTPEERIDWITKMFVIDKTNEIPKVKGKQECYDFSNKVFIDFSGFPDISFNQDGYKYSLENNGRFNLPIYRVDILSPNFNHSMNGGLVRDNPLNFNDWYFKDTYFNDVEAVVGDIIPKDCTIEIMYVNYNKDYLVSLTPIVKFQLTDGQPTQTYKADFLVLSRPTQVSVTEETQTPKTFSLSQNYPNPFNPRTTIEYNLEKPGKVTLEVFNIAGQRLETIVDGNQTAGNHRIKINLTGRASGTYFCKLRVGDNVETRKMMLGK
jgi:hypothetical protein